MQLTGLTRLLHQHDRFQATLNTIQQGAAALNLVRSARPFALAAIASEWQGPVLYLTARGRRAHDVVEQLPVWLGDARPIYRFAEPTPMFYDRLPWEKDDIRARLEVLSALMPPDDSPDDPQPVVIASARALMSRTLPTSQFRAHALHLRRGDRITPDKLMRAWMRMGYEPGTMVIEPGSFSRRGGILDVFPLAAELPVRIDFFDDEIDTIRSFDPETQRSITEREAVAIVPAREALPEQTPPLASHLSAWFESLRAQSEGDMTSPHHDADALANGAAFAHLEYYLPYLAPHPVGLLDYAPADALVVIEEPDELREAVQSLADDAEANREHHLTLGTLPSNYPRPYLDWDAISVSLGDHEQLIMGNLGESERLFTPGGRYGGQLRPMLTGLRRQREQGDRVVIVTQQPDRLSDLWYEQDTSAPLPRTGDITDAPEPGSLVLVEGSLSEGWSLSMGEQTLHLVTDAEIFGWSRPEPRRRKARVGARGRLPESDYADWNPGEHIVHVDYGIGRYVGMQNRTVEGTEREYLVLEYDGTDRLFVPIHQADRLTRYVGPDETPPHLNKLGKPQDWAKARSKAKQAAEEEAKELLAIYAARASARGHAFSPDTAWQHELEASFPYVETDDQLRALREIKTDMQSSMPMDRLICGDVGYGKTEVALRAAFKAVMDNKQVAVLVPTTVLAQQHYETFSRRLEPFPVVVEALSRFRTKAEQNAILGKLDRGEIDILIGTHRLLSGDINLNKLGLIIIDEEQRFGVKHKEHFKSLRANVDVLTLTATPIPRTLYMSLSGVRDISMIQTPPEDRLPVVTHVGSFDEKMLRQAVLRELDRGGQIFVVHNRVRTIEALQQRLSQIVPEARTIVAHGQMSGRQLERVMTTFGHGEYDILIATAIIESGIDMPNVNTLIVDRAELFGVSQLYQIRGRVGRSAQQAYAYFFSSSRLTEEARARLETLAEHTALGAGFQIAVRDLELRGAGDILSMRQSGHMVTVGLNLYTQMLQQAIRGQRGDASSDSPRTAVEAERLVIDLPLPAYIPVDWIPEMALRLQIYRRIGNLQTVDDVQAMRDELRDRFGQLPEAVEGLLYQMQVKIMAQAVSATAVIKPRDRIQVKLPYLAELDRDALARDLDDAVVVTRTAIEVDPRDEIWQWRLVDVLEKVRAGLPEEAVGI